MDALSLLRERRFGPLFATQFFGAFNDNLYKNALVILLTFQTVQWTTMKVDTLTNLAMGLFMLPFFLFSATSGMLADKFDKARIARISKVLEIVIILIAGAGFALHHLGILLVALFLMGLQSTLFGPVKYALLPQHLRPEELVQGNAMVEAATFISILLGTLAGGILADTKNGPVWIMLGSMTVAILGYLSSRAIPPAPAPSPHLKLNFNPVTETWRCIGFARENRPVLLAVLGISWFWLYGSVMLAQFPNFTKSILGGQGSMATFLLTIFALGIGGGSLLCGKLSRERPNLRFTFLGGVGMTLFGLDLAWASTLVPGVPETPLAVLLQEPTIWRVLVDLLGLGLSGGLYGVPLYTLMQQESNPACRARVIAANNILNSFFIVLAAIVAMFLLSRGWSIPRLFTTVTILNLLVVVCGGVWARSGAKVEQLTQPRSPAP